MVMKQREECEVVKLLGKGDLCTENGGTVSFDHNRDSFDQR